MKPSRIRAPAVALVFAALVSSALAVFALHANAALPAPTLPPCEGPRHKSGLLGAIASGLSSVEADFSRGRTPFNYWGGRFNAAGNELFTIVSGQSRESFGHTLFNYCLTLAGWGVCAFLLVYLQRYLHK